MAVDVEQQTPLTITDSRFQDNGRGVKAFACAPCAITNNSFTGGDVGLEFLENYWPLTVRGNSIIGAGVGIALSQGLGGPGPKVIANNTMKYNDSSGLVVRAWRFSSPPPRLEVIGNVFKNNGYNPSDPWLGSGPTAGHPLTAGAWANYGYFAGNTAIANAGYGIEGIDNPGSVGDGVVDGGGNIARANGGDPQCLGLVCSSKP